MTRGFSIWQKHTPPAVHLSPSHPPAVHLIPPPLPPQHTQQQSSHPTGPTLASLRTYRKASPRRARRVSTRSAHARICSRAHREAVHSMCCRDNVVMCETDSSPEPGAVSACASRSRTPWAPAAAVRTPAPPQYRRHPNTAGSARFLICRTRSFPSGCFPPPPLPFPELMDKGHTRMPIPARHYQEFPLFLPPHVHTILETTRLTLLIEPEADGTRNRPLAAFLSDRGCLD